jgi:hypothetical protein
VANLRPLATGQGLGIDFQCRSKSGHSAALNFLDPSRLCVSLQNLSAALGLLELIHAYFCTV